MTSVKQIKSDLQKLANKEDARQLRRFFKTGKDQYGEGDQFLGIRVPELRKLARQYDGVSAKDAARLLRSKFHEERMLALIVLVNRYRKGNLPENEEIYQIYLGHTKFINNWELVDTSA